MDKNSLLKELSYINAARINRMRVANLVLQSQTNFKPLLDIAFDVNNKNAIKAAWVLEFVITLIPQISSTAKPNCTPLLAMLVKTYSP